MAEGAHAMTLLAWLLIGPLFLVALCMYLCVLLAAGAAVYGLWKHLRFKAEVRRGLRDMRHEPAPDHFEHPGWPP
jgi:hypothetical protein